MPTGPKAVAAVLFAALAFWVTLLVGTYPLERFAPGLTPFVAAALGALMGWRTVGASAGGGWAMAAGLGLTAAVATAFWTLFFEAVWLMLARSLSHRYDGPVEAVLDVAALIVTHGLVLLQPLVFAAAFGGALACGWLTEAVARALR